jgi:hypothetical protein
MPSQPDHQHEPRPPPDRAPRQAMLFSPIFPQHCPTPPHHGRKSIASSKEIRYSWPPCREHPAHFGFARRLARERKSVDCRRPERQVHFNLSEEKIRSSVATAPTPNNPQRTRPPQYSTRKGPYPLGVPMKT